MRDGTKLMPMIYEALSDCVCDFKYGGCQISAIGHVTCSNTCYETFCCYETHFGYTWQL